MKEKLASVKQWVMDNPVAAIGVLAVVGIAVYYVFKKFKGRKFGRR